MCQLTCAPFMTFQTWLQPNVYALKFIITGPLWGFKASVPGRLAAPVYVPVCQPILSIIAYKNLLDLTSEVQVNLSRLNDPTHRSVFMIYSPSQRHCRFNNQLWCSDWQDPQTTGVRKPQAKPGEGHYQQLNKLTHGFLKFSVSTMVLQFCSTWLLVTAIHLHLTVFNTLLHVASRFVLTGIAVI